MPTYWQKRELQPDQFSIILAEMPGEIFGALYLPQGIYVAPTKCLGSKIEDATLKDEYVMGEFVDIKRAFDCDLCYANI